MPSELNLYRSENYQNYVNNYQKENLAKSISEAKTNGIRKIDDDEESINSVAESLNNYLDVKVRTLMENFFVELILSANFESLIEKCFK